MTMKLRVALGLAAALLVGAAACTDPTVAPKSSVTGANFFNDPNSYRAFLAKIYGGLALSGQQGPAGNPDIAGIDEGFSQYLRLYWETQELPTDEAIIGWNDIGLPEMNTMTWTSTSSMVVAMYYRVFFQVGMANEFLRETTPAKLASRGVPPSLAAQVQTYRAEARFLRALSYWHGIDLFGNIPLVTENDPLAATPKQSTRDSIYNFIVSELVAIKPDLPLPSATTYGRATQPAADMLLAQLYLNAGVYAGTPNYAGALTAAQNVIASGSYSLDANYRHMFMADNNTSPEIIFAIPFDGVRTQTWGGTTFLVHASCGGNMKADSSGVDGCWWGLRLKPQADSFFVAGDKRSAYLWGPAQDTAQHLAVTTIGNFYDGVAAAKFVNRTSAGVRGSNPTFPDTDFPMFRLGEAYLIYAEANLRGGGGSAATGLNYFNALRVRAFGDSSHVVSSITLDSVLAERGRELLWEAHRRTDLVRYGRFTGGSYLWAWKGGVLGGTSTDAHLNIYPLPASELIANTNLKQNTGY
jgi:starch-binding outer membrane protein, SusD/RagB family